MDALSRFLMFLALLTAIGSVYAENGKPTPIGVWRVIGDKSGESEALVRISERDGVYEGRITLIYPRPGVDPDARCELCPGTRKNQPVKGLLILSGLRHVENEFLGGEILDPDSGDLYQCSLRVSDDNRRLFVRGFIGIALFGRTQTWLRE